MAKRKSGGNPAKTGWDPIEFVAPNTSGGMGQAFQQTGGRKHHYSLPQPAARSRVSRLSATGSITAWR